MEKLLYSVTKKFLNGKKGKKSTSRLRFLHQLISFSLLSLFWCRRSNTRGGYCPIWYLSLVIKMNNGENKDSGNGRGRRGRRENRNSGNGTVGGSRVLSNSMSDKRCFRCGRMGHVSYQCPLSAKIVKKTDCVHEQSHSDGPPKSSGGIKGTGAGAPTQNQQPILSMNGPITQRPVRKFQYINMNGASSAPVNEPNVAAKASESPRKTLDKKKKWKDRQQEKRQRPTSNEEEPEDKTEESNGSQPRPKKKGKKKPDPSVFDISCLPFDIKSISADRIKTYSAYLQQLVDKIRLKESDHEDHDKLRSALQSFLRERLGNHSITVSFFGSACNGFGCENCDLDLCIDGMKRGSPPAKVNTLAAALRRCSQVNQKSVLAITAAKVPIVKFTAFNVDEDDALLRENHITDYHCDLSVSNDLALENTLLLETYTQIDDRVASLGMLVKYWAKICNICDASLGSLSSYAYIILILHFLQKKGVIPVLQELVPKEREVCPKVIVNGCNVWFFEDLDDLGDVWPEGFDKNKNQESLLELFFGFLKYYGQDFDFENNVITCRTSKTVTRKEKHWDKQVKQSLAIEDPFLINRNLSAKRDASIFFVILSCFRATYNHLITRMKSFDPWKTTPSAEVEALFDYDKVCPFHEEAAFKFRCECGRLEPKKRPKSGKCICGLLLPEKKGRESTEEEIDEALVVELTNKRTPAKVSSSKPVTPKGNLSGTKRVSPPAKPGAGSNGNASKPDTPSSSKTKKATPVKSGKRKELKTQPKSTDGAIKVMVPAKDANGKISHKDLWKQMEEAKKKSPSPCPLPLNHSKEKLLSDLYNNDSND